MKALGEGIGSLSGSMFADTFAPGEWVWVECEDDALLFVIGDLGSVVQLVEQPA